VIDVDLIFKLMKQQGKTQKDLAISIGASQGNVSDWKKGKAQPSAKVLPKIAAFLGVPTARLLGETDDLSQTQNKAAAHLQGGVDISDLPKEDQEDIKEYIAFKREQRKNKA